MARAKKTAASKKVPEEDKGNVVLEEQPQTKKSSPSKKRTYKKKKASKTASKKKKASKSSPSRSTTRRARPRLPAGQKGNRSNLNKSIYDIFVRLIKDKSKTIGTKVIYVLDDIALQILEEIAIEASALATASQRKTITPAIIHSAIRNLISDHDLWNAIYKRLSALPVE